MSGASAYEIWLQQDNTGTEEDFLNSLKGKVQTYKTADVESALAYSKNNPDVFVYVAKNSE